MNYLALLRGINVSGRNRIPMEELESLCSNLGWNSVGSYLQTGNVVFTASKPASALELELEQVIESNFGFSIPVIVRSAPDFKACVAESPLSDLAASDPSRVLLYLAKSDILEDVLHNLETRSAAGERLFVRKGALWIHFPSGIGKSKLTPSVIDKAVGSTTTGRNWNTLSKIREMLG
ncbi:MAG: DUF1697 domain-containing protein [Verrucomicrobiota bacterium]